MADYNEFNDNYDEAARVRRAYKERQYTFHRSHRNGNHITCDLCSCVIESMDTHDKGCFLRQPSQSAPYVRKVGLI